MAVQYWDDVLYPSFRAAIRGTIYTVLTQDELDEECYNLACRAIAAFKFPKVDLSYTTFYAYWDDDVLEEVDPNDEDEMEDAVPHAYFDNEVGFAEISIVIAWMKVYWTEMQISNADNFEDMYTDVNIKSYSRANAVDKNLKTLEYFRAQAKDLENQYSRVNSNKKPALGDVNEDE